MECERKMYVLLYRFMVHYENVANFEIPFFLWNLVTISWFRKSTVVYFDVAFGIF